MVRVVIVLSLACGVILDAAIGPGKGKKTGENTLFRGLHDGLEEGDIVLGDRYFGSYWELALLHRRGVDSVMRMHQLRKVDFALGLRLGTLGGENSSQRPSLGQIGVVVYIRLRPGRACFVYHSPRQTVTSQEVPFGSVLFDCPVGARDQARRWSGAETRRPRHHPRVAC